MANYTVNHTDDSLPPITVIGKRINSNSLDVPLIGKIRLEYGEEVNETLLNILENFACPALSSDINQPDTSKTTKSQLTKPTIGQFWYNKSNTQIYFWNGDLWEAVPLSQNYAANWGQIMHGQPLPKPISPNGYTFDYDQCIWSVSPASILGKVAFMNCTTDNNAVVNMRYRYSGSNDLVDGAANYLIIGLAANSNTDYSMGPINPSPTPTVTPTVTATLTPTPAASVTPSITVSVTPPVTPTATSTPTPTPVESVTPTVTRSATPVPTSTPTPTVTPTPSPRPALSTIVNGGGYTAGSRVVNGATAGAGVRFLNSGGVSYSANPIASREKTHWLVEGYNPSDYEVSFVASFDATYPNYSGFTTPAGQGNPGGNGVWYNLGQTRGWSMFTTRDTASLVVSFYIRRVGDSSDVVTGTIFLHVTVGNPPM